MGTSNSESRPRLLETSPDDRAAYIALSHCWGLDQTFRILRGNLEAMKEGFDLTDMPKTFKDAIELTRALDFKFLWIDSLCIIQDDSMDWEIESSKICDVCANTTLTIGNAMGYW